MIHRIAQAAVLMLLLACVATTAYANEAPLLRVTFLDVHQGDCILIRSAEKTIMIDAGDDNRNAAQRYIIPYLKKEGILPLGVEGEANAQWVLLDYDDVVISIFQAQTRAFYDLENLWEAPRMEIDGSKTQIKKLNKEMN